MIRNPVPDWIRIILSVFSLVSFLPELRDIWVRKDSTGISLYYVLFNLISATEQFTLGFFLLFTNDSDVFIHDPINTGDWLNLAQLTVAWLMFLVLLATCLHFSSSAPAATKTRVVATYIAFLLISTVPIIAEVASPGDHESSRLFRAAFFYMHSTFVNPVVTVGAISSFFCQKSTAYALNKSGLAVQALVFAIVALSWLFRINFPVVPQWSLSILITWYELVGWAAVDNAVFAAVQFILLLATGHQQKGRGRSLNPEEEQLLSH